MPPAPPKRGTLVVDRRNIVAEVDAGACALLGYAKDELLGIHGSELIVLEEQPATATAIDRMRRGEFSFRSARMRCKDGAVIEIEVRAERLANGRLAFHLSRPRCAAD